MEWISDAQPQTIQMQVETEVTFELRGSTINRVNLLISNLFPNSIWLGIGYVKGVRDCSDNMHVTVPSFSFYSPVSGDSPPA